MGANCCVPARNKPSPRRISYDVPNIRNARHSPSWSFRWDNRTHIEDIIESPCGFSHHNSVNVSSEIKRAANPDIEGISDGGSSFDTIHPFKLRKSSNVGFAERSKSFDADRSTGSNSPPEEKGYAESSAVGSNSNTKPSISIPSISSSSSLKAADPSTSRSFSLSFSPSPVYQFSSQVSDTKIPSLKSLNESGSCSPESRQSLVLSLCSNDMSAEGSKLGSSDNWSMKTFFELVAASSHRDRWSFDSETLSPFNTNLPRSSPLSCDMQICRICSRLLKERVSLNEVSLAAVLVCGHVYHAECLESMTSELDRYDPHCPVCTYGEKLGPILEKTALKTRNKISRRAVADINVHDNAKAKGKKPMFGASTSMKSSLGRLFSRRSFSIGSRLQPSRSVSETEATRKKKKSKGLWGSVRR